MTLPFSRVNLESAWVRFQLWTRAAEVGKREVLAVALLQLPLEELWSSAADWYGEHVRRRSGPAAIAWTFAAWTATQNCTDELVARYVRKCIIAVLWIFTWFVDVPSHRNRRECSARAIRNLPALRFWLLKLRRIVCGHFCRRTHSSRWTCGQQATIGGSLPAPSTVTRFRPTSPIAANRLCRTADARSKNAVIWHGNRRSFCQAIGRPKPQSASALARPTRNMWLPCAQPAFSPRFPKAVSLVLCTRSSLRRL